MKGIAKLYIIEFDIIKIKKIKIKKLRKVHKYTWNWKMRVHINIKT